MGTSDVLAAPVTDRSKRQSGVTFWAALGGFLLAFEVFVLARWVLGPNFKRTPTGPDPISDGKLLYFTLLQIVVSIAAIACLYFWVVKPWRREGKLTTDGMIALAAAMIFFWDMNMNYTSVSLLYNSHLINFGAWANGAWPGWTSPSGNLLPEPLLVVVPGYTCLVFAQVVVICALLRRARRRWPNMGVIGSIGFIILGTTIVDSCIEIALMRTGVYAYPGGIRAVTLFAGETYQFPLTEGFFFGGLGVGSMAVLKYFRNDKGQTLADRGVEHLNVSEGTRQRIKFLAIFGFVHGLFFLLYMVPNQWLATHADRFPEGYPSYMINNMCASGASGDECPGPGVPMPRP